MSVKFRVYDDRDEEGTPSEHLFNQDRITIGRGSDNDLTLSDPKRIVSTEHAEVRRSGHTYQLVDRGSKNFTYLHDQRLEAGRPYELTDGDTFRIGDFEIEFVLADTEDSSPAPAETVFAAGFSNPFTDPAQSLVESLENIIEAYEQETPQRRDDALQEA